MSALVSGQGAVFVTETSGRSASVAGAFLSETALAVSYDDFAGDLSTPVALAADLTVILAPAFVDFAGDLAAAVALAAGLTFIQDFAGDLSPLVALAADLTLVEAPEASLYGKGSYGLNHYSLGGSLGRDVPFEGDLPIQINLACSGLLSGPLWASSAPSPPPWAPSEPCPPSMWTPTGPCDPIEWEETELCDG